MLDNTLDSGYDCAMHFTEMTDEALALMSADLDAAGVHEPAPAPKPHSFGGIDGRCWDCDVRPSSGRKYPCI